MEDIAKTEEDAGAEAVLADIGNAVGKRQHVRLDARGHKSLLKWPGFAKDDDGGAAIRLDVGDEIEQSDLPTPKPSRVVQVKNPEWNISWKVHGQDFS